MSLPSKKAIQVDENTVSYEYKMLNHVMSLVYQRTWTSTKINQNEDYPKKI